MEANISRGSSELRSVETRFIKIKELDWDQLIDVLDAAWRLSDRDLVHDCLKRMQTFTTDECDWRTRHWETESIPERRNRVRRFLRLETIETKEVK